MTQCNNCRYASQSIATNEPICLVAWDGDDERKTSEAVEWILMELAEAYSCPSFVVKGSNVVDSVLTPDRVVA